MRTLAFVLGLAAAAPAQEAAERLQKMVEACSRHITERFVFFGGGSGVIISEDGLCLTNHHVVAAGNNAATAQARVTLHSGKQYFAKLVCTDEKGDLALYRLQGQEGEKFPYAELGDSDKLEVGQYVMACGNPFGITLPDLDRKMYPSISLGIVSALHRHQMGGYFDCIQTDASLNPGNSGGPLVTLDGKVAGINGRIATRYMNRVNSGVGYSIPANQIRNFLPEMMKGGESSKIYHGQLNGLFLSDAPTNGEGARVSSVRAGSTADSAGLQKDDLIVRVNHYAVHNRERLVGALGTYPMGTEVTLRVRRGDETKDLKAKLDRYQDGFGFLPPGGLPRVPAPVRPKGSGYLGATIEEKEGVVTVVDVTPGAPADLADLKEGDILQSIDGRRVTDRQQFLTRLWRRKPGDKVKLGIRRGDKELEVEASLAKHPDD
jgi:serine protease Do